MTRFHLPPPLVAVLLLAGVFAAACATETGSNDTGFPTELAAVNDLQATPDANGRPGPDTAKQDDAAGTPETMAGKDIPARPTDLPKPQTCGNGLCDLGQGESCATCPQDCPCACGYQCEQGQCMHAACAGKQCGNDGCGGSCGQCPDGEDCEGGVCKGEPPVVNYTCKPIGSAYSDGFFTLAEFKGKLYAGQFGYGHENQSMLFSYPEWQLTSPGLKGISESVCAMAVFKDHLYANTESSGDIFKSADGNNWVKVFDGDNGSIGCAMAVFKDKLYAVNYRNSQEDHGRVLRKDGANWTTVYDSGSTSLYLREMVAYNGVLYTFGVIDGQGHMLTSGDGQNFNLQQVANRYFRGHVWQGHLWLGSTDYYANGEVAVWRFDGAEFMKVLQGSDRYFTNLQDVDGKLFASTSNGWKNESGPSALWMSPDGYNDWQQLCEFSETAIWDMAAFNGELYLGTWHYGKGGKVYKVSGGR